MKTNLTPSNSANIKCVLFDLDGTLIDTSYDFCYAINATCDQFNQPPLLYQNLRNVVSEGGQAITELAFPHCTPKEITERKNIFLQTYYDNITRHSQIFPGLLPGLQTLAKHAIPWGIVTNKPRWLTEKLFAKINFPSQPLCIICGDDLPNRKPHRDPMDLAAKQCATPNKHCLYLGDHPRDIQAGINAEMQTGAALFGYIPVKEDYTQWNAQFVFNTPYDISAFLSQQFET